VGSISGHTAKDGTYIFNVCLVIKNTQQLNKIIRDLRNWPDVIEVNRVNN